MPAIPSSASPTPNPNSAEARVIRWADVPEDHPLPLIDRRRIIGKHMMISQVLLHKGFTVATHQHANEQFAWVNSGRVRFVVGAAEGDEDSRGGHEVVLEAGEVLHLPPHVPHSAEALEDSVVFDLFSPPSERTGVDRQ